MHRLFRLSIVAIFCILSIKAFGLQLKFNFQPGKIYDYEFSGSENSAFSAYKMTHSDGNKKTSAEFSIRSIAFQDGAFIVDIGSSNGTIRRYIKENGEIKGAPGESGLAVPFLITLPGDDWKINEKKQFRKELFLGSQKITAAWNLLLKSHDAEKNIAEILFVLGLKMPEDRLRKKDLSLKGRVLFNVSNGVIQQAEWNSSYQLELINKEIAVSRPLWNFSRQTSHSLLLKNIREQ